MGLGIAKHELKMLALLLSGAFLTVLNATLLTPALPAIMGDLAIEATTAQWLTSGYTLTEAVVIPLAAYLMGRFTTRRLFIGGMALFGGGSLLAALAPAFPALLAGRVMQAFATGFIMPMVFSVVLLVIPRERRGSAIGVVSLIVGFAPTIGPSLSGVLVDTAGWRAIFAIVTALSAAIIVFAVKDLQPYGSLSRSKFDAPSVALSTFGLVGLLYGLSSFSSSDNLAATAALTAAGLVLVGAYAWRQLHLDEPMLRLDILKVPQYRITIIIVALIQTGLIGLQTIMPLYIQGTL
uniref:MFS transporter n=1 Tax=uncultured Senegalimassilia sp. TaxID=1714350 RepID=UPI0025FA1399